MYNSGYFPPPVFNGPPPGQMIRPSVFNWQPPGPGTFSPNWCVPPPGPWGFNSSVNQYNAPGHQNAGFLPQRAHGQYPKFGRQRGGVQNGPSRNARGKQKNKKEPAFTHFCDTCDRAFKDQQKYDDHMAQHVKCSVKDCTFTAHEKLVSIHWKNNHAPGAKRIKLDTPDEITKWREDRRKNYPTLSNVVRKRKMMEEREERGEVLETAQFGKMRSRHVATGWGQGSKNVPGNKGLEAGAEDNEGKGAEKPRPAPKQANEGDPLGALADSDSDSDKDGPADTKKEGMIVTPRHMTSGLGSLLASYASDSDSDQEPVALPILRTSKALEENQAMLKTLAASAQSGVSEQGAIKHPENRGNPQQSSHQSARPHAAPCRPGRGSGRGRGRGSGRGRGRGSGMNISAQRRTTLLEMLLAPDIRHERNVVLQCVRYVVQNSFFGLDRKPLESMVADGRDAVVNGSRHLEVCQLGGRGLDGASDSLQNDTVIGGNEVITKRWQGTQVENIRFGQDHRPADNCSNPGEAQSLAAEDKVIIQTCNPEETPSQLGNPHGGCDSPEEDAVCDAGEDKVIIQTCNPEETPQQLVNPHGGCDSPEEGAVCNTGEDKVIIQTCNPEETSNQLVNPHGGCESPEEGAVYDAGEDKVTIQTCDPDETPQQLGYPQSDGCACPEEGAVSDIHTPPADSSLPAACCQEDKQSSVAEGAVIGSDTSFSQDTDQSQQLHEGHYTAENAVIDGKHHLLKGDYVIGGIDSLAENMQQSDLPSCSVVDDEIWEIPVAYVKNH